jgi:predicted dehydrogenase
MIRASRQTGSNLGIDYVLRHHPAFELLALLAASGLFGPLRALSLENFAQALPPNHWMWDEAVSGGILVEHGVHFLDAYGWLAGTPSYVWGSAPRREAVQITVQYAEGAIVTHYHEFAFPQAVERTHATLFFQQGYIEISGWIPARLSGKVVETIGTVESVLQRSQHPFTLRKEDGATWFDLQFPGRSQAYQSAIAGGMRELIARHRDPAAPMTVSAGNARESLALALAARQACVSGSVVQITETSSFEGGKFGSLGNERKRTLSQASAERGPPN